MGIAERKQRQREALQERMLDAALELVTAQGPEALTMRAIADRIEYSATALYAHFADKDALLSALCRREFAQLSEVMLGFTPPDDPLERLRFLGRAYCQFAIEHPQAYRLMFLLEGMPSRPECVEDGDLDAYNICVDCVRLAREAGALDPVLVDDELTAQTLWASLHGVLALEIVKRDKGIPWRAISARVDAVLDLLINGLRRR